MIWEFSLHYKVNINSIAQKLKGIYNHTHWAALLHIKSVDLKIGNKTRYEEPDRSPQTGEAL